MTGPAMDRINALSRSDFLALFGTLYEHSPWAAELAEADQQVVYMDTYILVEAMVDLV